MLLQTTYSGTGAARAYCISEIFYFPCLVLMNRLSSPLEPIFCYLYAAKAKVSNH